MYKWYQVLVQDLDEDVDENLKKIDENLAWLTQKIEDLKVINGNLLSPHTHAVNVIELHCKVIKKWKPLPPFLHHPSFQVYPPFLAKKFVPPMWLRASDYVYTQNRQVYNSGQYIYVTGLHNFFIVPQNLIDRINSSYF